MPNRKWEEWLHKTSKVIRQSNKQLEFGLECSVKDNVSIKEAIMAAYDVSVYSLKHLMNKDTKALQPNFIKALTRIFRIIDDDSDGWLSDKNLMQLQQLVFKIEMRVEEVKFMKDKISEEINENSIRYGIDLNAFILIFKKMLDMIKIKNCWVF